MKNIELIFIRNIILIFLLSTQYYLVETQVKIDRLAQLNQEVIAHFNKGTYKDTYPIFKINDKDQWLSNLMVNFHKETGEIKSTKLLEKCANGRSFVWIGEKKKSSV